MNINTENIFENFKWVIAAYVKNEYTTFHFLKDL